MGTKPQWEKTLNYMKKHGSISSWEAIHKLHETRLSALIYILKQKGYKISSEIKKGKNIYGEVTHFTVYRLAEEKEK
jgi:hypothetical protein